MSHEQYDCTRSNLFIFSCAAGDAGVEPGGVRLRAAGAEHDVPARGGCGLRRHPRAGRPPRPADAAGGPGEALSATPAGLAPHLYYIKFCVFRLAS